LELRIDFGTVKRVYVCDYIITALVTDQFKYRHELINGLAVYHTLVTLVGIDKKLAVHGVNNAACQVLVLHGGVP
jgi:hypothetical protein